MSRAVSPSSNKPYGAARVVALWTLPRSSFYAALHRERQPREAQKRGPKVHSDVDLVAAIRQLLEQAVFSGEGYRKIWARLRSQGHPDIEGPGSAAVVGKSVTLADPAAAGAAEPSARRDDCGRSTRSDVGHRRPPP